MIFPHFFLLKNPLEVDFFGLQLGHMSYLLMVAPYSLLRLDYHIVNFFYTKCLVGIHRTYCHSIYLKKIVKL